MRSLYRPLSGHDYPIGKYLPCEIYCGRRESVIFEPDYQRLWQEFAERMGKAGIEVKGYDQIINRMTRFENLRADSLDS